MQTLADVAGICTGLTPVLRAVAELPACGLSIPSSAQAQVRQFLKQQVDISAAAAGSTSATATAVSNGCVIPRGVKNLLELRKHLQELADNIWPGQEFAHARPLISAAGLLAADAARAVAQQQVLERNSPAYTAQLIEGNRAGAACWLVVSQANSHVRYR